MHFYIRLGADKYVVRPGKKQATANKPGIYSSYFLRSTLSYFIEISFTIILQLQMVMKHIL